MQSKVSLVKNEDHEGVQKALELIKDDIENALTKISSLVIKINLVVVRAGLSTTPIQTVKGFIDCISPFYKGKIILAEKATWGDTQEGFKKYGFTELAEEEDNLDFFVATDDGSCGEHCLITKSFERVVQEMKENNQLQVETPITIFGVGPELMLKSLYDSSLAFFNHPKIQMSLADRYMKCGTGVCGSCNVDDDKFGFRLCKEGPVFEGKTLKDVEDFGVFKKDATGRKIKI